MTQEVATKEEQPNPYNQKKSWHKQEDKPFVSANDTLFFEEPQNKLFDSNDITQAENVNTEELESKKQELSKDCLLYTSPSPRDVEESRMPSSA